MGILNAIRASYGALHILYRLSGIINLFCKPFDRDANCRARQRAELPRSGLLNGQNRPPIETLPYGAWHMGRNGCEAIAVYNTMQALGTPVSLAEVTEQLEREGLLFNGFGGTNLGALEPFFRSRGVTVKILRRRDRADFDRYFSGAACAILAYWTGNTLRRADKSWNTLHTVSVHRCPDGISVCNVSTNGTEPVSADSVEAFLRRGTAVPVCLFLLRKM